MGTRDVRGSRETQDRPRGLGPRGLPNLEASAGPRYGPKLAPRNDRRSPGQESNVSDQMYGDDNESDPRAEQRRELLEAAESLLAEKGPDALSLRPIAERAGVSTQMIYTLFGGKPELLRALHRYGYAKLADYLEDIPETDAPREELAALGRAYRRFALDHPALYRVMTGPPRTDHDRARAAEDRETRSFQILEDCIRRCIRDGHYAADADPREAADVHWSMVHGAVGLEVAGFYDDPEVADARFERALRAVAAGFRATDGD